MIGQFSHDGIGYKTLVKFADSDWSAIIVNFNLFIVSQIKSVCLRCVCQLYAVRPLL